MVWEDAGVGVSKARTVERGDRHSWSWAYWEVPTRYEWLVDWRVGRDGESASIRLTDGCHFILVFGTVACVPPSLCSVRVTPAIL